MITHRRSATWSPKSLGSRPSISRGAATDTDRVRTAVKKLRRKLGDSAADPAYIFNEHGVGYCIAIPAPPVPDRRVAPAGGRPPGKR